MMLPKYCLFRIRLKVDTRKQCNNVDERLISAALTVLFTSSGSDGTTTTTTSGKSAKFARQRCDVEVVACVAVNMLIST